MLQKTTELLVIGNRANNKYNLGKSLSVTNGSSRNDKILTTGNTKLKNLSKSKKLNFVKANSFKTEFFTSKTKKAFTYL